MFNICSLFVSLCCLNNKSSRLSVNLNNCIKVANTVNQRDDEESK